MNAYFDHNATTALSRVAREAWLEAVDVFWHNPSSLYREAGRAKRHLEDAREQLADHLGADPERVVFTSGATEANNAVLSHSARFAIPGAKVAISSVEHPSVREPTGRDFGKERVIELSVSKQGAVDVQGLVEALDRHPVMALVSVMAANNETGVLQPWSELAALCREREVPFHCDAAQWLGKLPAFDMGDRCDFVTGSAHKFGGPKGVGFLLIPDREIDRFRSAEGGPQESGHRAGTEDLPGILAMMAALEEKSAPAFVEGNERRSRERDAFESELRKRLPGVRSIAADADRLWNTVMFVVPEYSNLKWVTRLSALGFAVSTGSACSAGRGNPSRVMEAMGLDYEEMGRVIRVSGGWDTAAGDWEALISALETVAADLADGRRGGSGILGG